MSGSGTLHLEKRHGLSSSWAAIAPARRQCLKLMASHFESFTVVKMIGLSRSGRRGMCNVLYGATGMIGRGMLQECLKFDDSAVRHEIDLDWRCEIDHRHARAGEQFVHDDCMDYSGIAERLGDNIVACLLLTPRLVRRHERSALPPRHVRLHAGRE